MASQELPRPQPPSSLPRIPGYRIEGVLGRGTTGVVYSGIQEAVDRPVAIKLLHPELSGNRRAVRRLQREARTAARLGHPAIISALDLGEVDGRWWYAMELVEGISLAERIHERGVLTEREALRIFSPLADALQHAHEMGVVHRDIKPGNILLDARGRARMVDLGLAFAEDDPRLTKGGGTLGTPHYISPEQARDASKVDVRSDIWSLGATLYHALCGRPPFEGRSVAEILSAVLYHPVPDPRRFAPEMSRGMALVLRKCLSRDLSKRYAEPVELMRDLERLRERRAPDVRASALEPVDTGRPPLLRRALAVAGVAAVAGVLVVVGRSSRGPERNPDRPAEIRSPALEGLERRLREGELSVRATDAGLQQLLSAGAAAPLDPALLPEVDRLRIELATRLDRAVDDLVVELGEELEEDLAAGRLRDAARLVQVEAGRRLELSTGYRDPAEIPGDRFPSADRARAYWRELGERLTRAREAAVEEARQSLLSHYVSVVAPRAAELTRELRFREALELLGVDRGRWLAEADPGAAELERDARERVLDHEVLDIRVSGDRADVWNAWKRLDGQLTLFVADTAQRLGERLALGESGAADALARAWELRLVDLDLQPEDLPPGATWGSAQRLEEAREALARREVELTDAMARELHAEDLERAQALLRRRRYADAVALWDELLALDWRQVMHDEMRVARLESRLLTEFLERADTAVRALVGEDATFVVGQVPRRGVVRSVGQTVADGFLFEERGTGSVWRLYLGPRTEEGREHAQVSVGDLERLARSGPERPPADLERLVQALLRYHEGDADGAEMALPSRPVEGDEARVQFDLEERIRAGREAAAERRSSRQAEFDRLVYQIQRDQGPGGATPTRIVQRIDQVLAEYPDLLSEAAERELLATRARLSDQPEPSTLEEEWSGATVERDGRGQLQRVLFTFDGGSADGWQAGGWTATDGALELPVEARDEGDVLDLRRVPHLRLEPHLNTGEWLTARFTFEYVDGIVPYNEIVLTVAGQHFAFVDRAQRPLLQVASGEVGPLLEAVSAGERSMASDFAGFRKTRPNVFEVRLNPRTGVLGEVRLNGERLGLTALPDRSVTSTEADVLAVRSLQGLRLLEVELRGRERSRPR